jgi:ferredoxin
MSEGYSKSMNKNVCTEVVAHNLCIGCGVCAGICPRGNLRIDFNQYGEYNALETGKGCSEKCDLCLKVCPFYDHGENEDTIGKRLFADIPKINHKPETGYYLDTFVGYSNIDDHRGNGASGGLATWTLETLLRKVLLTMWPVYLQMMTGKDYLSLRYVTPPRKFVNVPVPVIILSKQARLLSIFFNTKVGMRLLACRVFAKPSV